MEHLILVRASMRVGGVMVCGAKSLVRQLNASGRVEDRTFEGKNGLY